MNPTKHANRNLLNTFEAIRYTPIGSTIVAALAVYSFWFAYLLIAVSSHLEPQVQTYRFHGPLEFASLQTWGWAFVGVGICELLRLVIHRSRKGISFALHVASMSVFMAWAVSYLVGSQGPDTGQPAYMFLALTAFVLPFLVDVLENRRNDRNPPPRPQDYDGDPKTNANQSKRGRR
jgi:hypothetical protein